MVVGGTFAGEGVTGMGSAAELGYYDAAFGVMMLIIAIHEAFVTTPLTFFNHRTKTTDDQKFAGKMLIISILFSILTFAGLTAVVGYKFLTAENNGGLMLALLALGFVLPFQMVRELARKWLLADLQVKQSAMIEILFAALFLILLAVLMLTKNISAASVFSFTAIANLACLAGWWMIYRRSFTLGFEGVGGQISDNFKYGKWIACENFCSVMMIYFSQWYLLEKLGVVGAGVYSACMTIVLLANPFLLGVASLFAPRAAQVFAKSSWAGLLKLLLGYSLFMTFVLTGFSVVLYFYGDLLTSTVFPNHQYQNYFDAHFNGINTTTFLMSIAMPCFGVSFLLTCCLLAADVPIYSFYAAIVGMTVTIITNLSYAEPTLNTAAMSFIWGVAASLAVRAGLVWYTYRQQTQLA